MGLDGVMILIFDGFKVGDLEVVGIRVGGGILLGVGRFLGFLFSISFCFCRREGFFREWIFLIFVDGRF